MAKLEPLGAWGPTERNRVHIKDAQGAIDDHESGQKPIDAERLAVLKRIVDVNPTALWTPEQWERVQRGRQA